MKKHNLSIFENYVFLDKFKIRYLIIFVISLLVAVSCRQVTDKEASTYGYFDRSASDTGTTQVLIAVTDDAHLQPGARVAYVNGKGDTVIPFGKYAYFGTDTLTHYANVIEHPNDSTYGRYIAIDRNQNVLFDLVIYDNGPDYYNEGMVRVLRNGKMGYANKYGQVVIPCEFDFARHFKNGVAEVTYQAKESMDMDEHRLVESDEWFLIDKKGNKVKQ